VHAPAVRLEALGDRTPDPGGGAGHEGCARHRRTVLRPSHADLYIVHTRVRYGAAVPVPGGLLPVKRFVRIALLASLAALVLPLAAVAADRMPVGFQDDPSFRWNGNAQDELDKVQAANASIIRATADWRAIAPTRPRNPSNSFDKAYHLNDLDDLVRNAQQRGIEVMITIWG